MAIFCISKRSLAFGCTSIAEERAPLLYLQSDPMPGAKTAPTGALAQPLLPPTTGAAASGTPLVGGILVLSNTILGAGMLGLPYAFAQCGFLLGPIMLLAFGLCSATALVCLSEAADHAGRPANFRSVSELAVPGAGVYIDVAVAIKCFGVATSYLIVIADSVPKAIAAFGATGIWLDRRLWTIAALAVAGPLAYMKQITALQHASKVALSCVLLITVMIVVFAIEKAFPDLMPDFDACAEKEDECEGTIVLVQSPMTILRALPVFVFSYTCHQNIFSITNELANPTRERNATVAFIAVSVALVIYILLGSSGYYTFGSFVSKDILVSYPQANITVAVARLAISLVVTCCYPLQAHPSRAAFSSIVKNCATVDEDVLHYSITTLFVVCTGSIAFMVDDLGMILSIVGATGSTIVSYILPGASYFLLFPDRASRWVGFGLLCIGLAIMPLSLGLIIQKIMSGAPLTPH